MSEYSGFFNAETDGNGNYDRSYSAEQFAAYFSAFIGNGVYITPATQLQVFAKGDGVTIGIKPGSAYINGYFYTNDGTIYKTLTLPDGKNSRIDRVVIRLDLQTRTIALDVLEGIASLNPTVKNVTRNGSIYELALADIKVDKSVVRLSDEDITDLRNNSELCGYVHGVVDQIDTTEIFKQFQSAFDNWFANVKYTLDGDVAGKLQNQIDYNKQRIEFGTIDTTQSSSANDSTEGDLIVTDFTKNFLGPTVETVTQNGVTCTKNSDGTYTLNGTAKENVTFHFNVIKMENGTTIKVLGTISGQNAWIGSDKYNGGTWKGAINSVGGTNSIGVFDCERLDVYIRLVKGRTANNEILKPMVTTDLNATYDDFVPYSGYEIKTCGKNLLNPKEYIDEKNVSNDGDILHAVNTNGDGRLWEYQNANYYFKAQTKTITLVIDVVEPSSAMTAGYVIFAEDNTRILNKDYATLINAGTYKHTLSVESGKTYGLMIKLYTGKVRVALYDSDTSDFEPYKGTSIQITRDTPPVYGLKSFDGCTHIISPGNVKAVYPVNKAGADLIQSIKSNGEKIQTLYSQVYGSGSDNGLLKRVGVLEKSKEYVDWLEEKCYPRDSVWFRTQIGNVRFLLDDFNMVSGVYMRTDNNFVVNHYGRLYPIEDNATTARAMQTYMILNTTKQITIPLTNDPSLKLFEVPKGPILRDLYRNDKQLSDVKSWSGACGGISANGCGAQINAKVDTESDANNIIVYIGTSDDSNAVLAKGAMIVVTAFSFGVQFKS